MKYRITSLERWGSREQTPYNFQQLKLLKSAGYNAVLINGGSGMGPDAISPELFIKSDIICDLMPETIAVHEKTVSDRIEKTTRADLESWLMWWGIPGPDLSHGTGNSIGTNYLDRLLKKEMHKLLEKQPEIFGFRNPKSCNWRGSRPLCLSSPKVRDYYNDIMKRLCVNYPQIKGIVFFPGDHNPDMCDHTCPRCSQVDSR